MIRVVRRNLPGQGKKVSRVYRVTFADVKRSRSPQEIHVETGSISSIPAPATSSSPTWSKIMAIDKFLEEIDRPTPQILVEARVYDITSTDQLDLGVEWNFGRNTNYGTSGITGFGDSSKLVDADNRTDPFMTGRSSSSTNKADAMQNVFRFGVLNESLMWTCSSGPNERSHRQASGQSRIMVLDNQQATIKIVEEVPIRN
jgi:type II secretory pathway component HofQ